METLVVVFIVVVPLAVFAGILYAVVAGRREVAEAKSQAPAAIEAAAVPQATVNLPAQPRPLTRTALFWIIFGALWAFSISAGIVYAVVLGFTAR